MSNNVKVGFYCNVLRHLMEKKNTQIKQPEMLCANMPLDYFGHIKHHSSKVPSCNSRVGETLF